MVQCFWWMCFQVRTSVPSAGRMHLLPWGNSKMYISGSIASSQRMSTEINESDAIAKIRVSVRILSNISKAFRIISSEMPTLLLILSW